ncbi:hypothetical protein QFC19_002612 [Naganishia cerealis]|uniref:Uncharacterized protein n=1 Tax=Naganishia cerealis TaxID=610337 RepID=A0ACC2W8Q9_9TREE|nr:hypothetical protein QFC19_002612 [Naganishia cerealis]
MSRFRISPALWDKIHHYSSFPQTGVSLQQMVLFGQNPSQGTLLKASQFLAEELPIRLSHRVKELDELPDGLAEMDGVRRVKEWYAESFQDLVTFPPPKLEPSLRDALMMPPSENQIPFPVATPNPSLHPHVDDEPGGSSLQRHHPSQSTWGGQAGWRGYGYGEGTGTGPNGQGYSNSYFSPPPKDLVYPPEVHEYNDKFTRMIERIKKRHDPTVTTVAQGILEWKRQTHRGGLLMGAGMQSFLDRFYMSRSHICFELLKNSLRAVVERHGVENEDSFPPIKVVVVEGKEDLTIKISDEGGGIPRSAMPQIWTYMYTTMSEAQDLDSIAQNDFKAPMAGFGYGLPLSRLGYGTAILSIPPPPFTEMATSAPLVRKPLFGGAIEIDIPSSFMDVSDFRQVPDTQEVYVCHDDETSLVMEILDVVTEGEAKSDLFEAANALAHDNAALSSKIETAAPTTPTPAQVLPALSQGNSLTSLPTPQPVILMGTQSVQKFNSNPPPPPDDVIIFLALWRVLLPNSTNERGPGRKADVLCTVNVNRGKDGIAEVDKVKEWFPNAVKGMKIVNYGLFVES